jgi:hypothetical protein
MSLGLHNQVRFMVNLYERRECMYCGKRFMQRWKDQRFCRAYCRRMGKAIEARSSRRAWTDAGRPIFEDVRAAFESDQAAKERIESNWGR